MLKVAIYLRKSRDENEEDKELVLKRHETQLLDYCKRNNLIVSKIYREIVSGDTIEHRPQMQQLLDDVGAGFYNGVVCMEIERLSRGNQLDQLEILETFKASDTKIYTLNKVYDLTNEDIDEEFFEFALFMSRREYKIIKRRMQRGKIQAQKDGYFTGSVCPFGYSKERRGRGWVLVPNDKAPLVKEIFNRYASGQTLVDITNYVNALGATTARNTPLDIQALRRILINKCYLGYINIKNRSATYKGLHEPIIDDELFNKVQLRLETNKPTKTKRKHKLVNPLATLLKCEKCGRVMALYNARGYVYRCPNMNCNTSGAAKERVEALLLKELQESLNNFNYLLDNYETETANKKDHIENEIKALKNDITKKEGQINKACEMLELGVYSKEKFMERTNILESAIKSNEERIDELNAVTYENDNIKQAIPIIEEVLKDYNILSVENKNKLLKAIIDHIDFIKDKRNDRSKKEELKLNIYLKI